ncbi:acid phosphatase type 7-like [Saccoglossus kowalevskii]|uniref:Purple acid phosphatase n=1 Tax=Saccoglossus kowalevskii TaxID=10224 RepID=A0ABM0GVH6_SACKO|nr:PREDICTED: iron/zinc purple acid phosphatase-like protein-like [Saccoglossus kowalevskii]
MTTLCVTLQIFLVLLVSVTVATDVTTKDEDQVNTIDSKFLASIYNGIGPVLNPPLAENTIELELPIPEQIHIAYGDVASEMIVMWSTPIPASSQVLYGLAPNNFSLSVSGDSVDFFDGNPDGLHYLHRVKLSNLIAGQNYSYKVRSDNELSDGYIFTAMKDGQDWSPVLLVYGDMGRIGGAPSLKLLRKEAASGLVDAVLHVGDFAYDLHTDGGKIGDDFMNRIQSIATRIPYMTAVGNHEIEFNFSHYRYRFSMPNSPWPMPLDNMWYSFNMAKVHFISYSTEVYFTDDNLIDVQYQWLLNDLQEANQPENRLKRPWIIVYGHRPMYCSNADSDDCTTLDSKVRNGLEELFFTQGVDLIIEAHEHSYERLYPVYEGKVLGKDYTNPKAPIHIISGAAGCNEFDGVCVNAMLGPRGDWSAFRAWLPGLYGFGKLHIVNETHIFWKQVLALNGQTIDSVWIEQHNHGPFNIADFDFEIENNDEEEDAWWLSD